MSAENPQHNPATETTVDGVTVTQNQQASQTAGQQPLSQPTQLVTKEKTGSAFGRGFGLGTGFTIGTAVVLTVAQIPFVIGMVALIALVDDDTSGSSSNVSFSDTVYGTASADNCIQAVDVTGAIMGENDGTDIFSVGTYGYDLAKTIDDIDKDCSNALILEMDTPGGTIYGSKAIADAVTRYKDRTGNKVYAFVKGMSASGGMYAMAGADEIIVDHGSLVGSIGVIFGPLTQYNNVTETDGGLLGGGVTAESIESGYITAGKGKDFGNPWRESSPEEVAHYQKQIDISYDGFVNHVAENRKLSPDVIKNELGAYLYTSDEAIRVGLADKKMSRPDAYNYILEQSGLTKDDAKITRKSEDGFVDTILSAVAPNMTPKTNSPWTGGVSPTPGVRSSADICNATAPLVYHGQLASVCGS